MRATAFKAVVFAMILPAVAAAESVALEGGRSPDAKYEVRLAKTPNFSPVKDGSDCYFSVRSKRGKSVLTLDGSGYRHYPAKDFCKVAWDDSSQFVAITEQNTRHTIRLQIAAFTEAGPTRLDLPDYVLNALGRVNATEVDRSCVTTIKNWNGDELFLELSFDANGHRSYKFDVTLHIRYENGSIPSVGLRSVTKLEESEG